MSPVLRCSYMCLADIYLPPLRLLQSVAARVCELTGQHLAAPSTVANFLFSIAAMGVLGPQQAAGLTDFLYRCDLQRQTIQFENQELQCHVQILRSWRRSPPSPTYL